jgi:hypothetical protein
MILQGIPDDLVLKVVKKEAAVEDTGQLIFEDQLGRVFASMLKKIQEFFIFHRAHR